MSLQSNGDNCIFIYTSHRGNTISIFITSLNDYNISKVNWELENITYLSKNIVDNSEAIIEIKYDLKVYRKNHYLTKIKRKYDYMGSKLELYLSGRSSSFGKYYSDSDDLATLSIVSTVGIFLISGIALCLLNQENDDTDEEN